MKTVIKIIISPQSLTFVPKVNKNILECYHATDDFCKIIRELSLSVLSAMYFRAGYIDKFIVFHIISEIEIIIQACYNRVINSYIYFFIFPCISLTNNWTSHLHLLSSKKLLHIFDSSIT